MITNLKDVIQNIKDLLEIKKEKLRVLWEDEKIIKEEILELERGLFKLDKPIERIEDGPRKPTSQELVQCIKNNGPVSRGEIAKLLNCTSRETTGLGYLLDAKKIFKVGSNKDGFDVFDVIERQPKDP